MRLLLDEMLAPTSPANSRAGVAMRSPWPPAGDAL
jgi:hypothetical protein